MDDLFRYNADKFYSNTLHHGCEPALDMGTFCQISKIFVNQNPVFSLSDFKLSRFDQATLKQTHQIVEGRSTRLPFKFRFDSFNNY